jgi:Ca2+-binding RTX toxin-like protein
VIVGRGGFDEIHGGAGDDLICGAVDHLASRVRYDGDTIFGGKGDDRIWGGRAEDIILGGPGDDRISGGHEYDTIHPGPGDDRVWGNGGYDGVRYIDAGRGVRVDLAAGLGTGEGRDTLIGIEYVTGSRFADVIFGDDGELNILNGEAGDDRLYGRGGRDAIEGRGGDDLLDGGPGWDNLLGGSGRDTCISGNRQQTGCES